MTSPRVAAELEDALQAARGELEAAREEASVLRARLSTQEAGGTVARINRHLEEQVQVRRLAGARQR